MFKTAAMAKAAKNVSVFDIRHDFRGKSMIL
jgi:hypothetical protein